MNNFTCQVICHITLGFSPLNGRATTGILTSLQLMSVQVHQNAAHIFFVCLDFLNEASCNRPSAALFLDILQIIYTVINQIAVFLFSNVKDLSFATVVV